MMIVLEELNLILLQMVRHILYFFYYLRTFGKWEFGTISLRKWEFGTMSLRESRNSGQYSFGKVEILDNVPFGK